MDINNKDEVCRFVEKVMTENVVNQIALELSRRSHCEVAGMLQQRGGCTVEELARKMHNILQRKIEEEVTS
jgi:hypothetical protein